MVDNSETSNSLSVVEEEDAVLKTVDATTRARCGSLAAHNFTDNQIADVLLLTVDQVKASRNSQEFKKKYAEIADEEIQKQIDLADGWDAVEEKAIGQVLETLEYNRDPRYALFAAKTANAAARRKGSGSGPHVIDNSKPVSNVVVLQLNKTYITKVTNEAGSSAVDITPRDANPPRRISDLPSPKSVEELLSPVRAEQKDKMLSELEQAFEISGVFKDDEPA